MARLPARFISKTRVDRTTGCWKWTGTILSRGYGQYYVGGGQKNRIQLLAHRFAYEVLIGPIPSDLTIDHLCRNRACVNPLHMEVVTRGENVLRGIGTSAVNKRKKKCIHGHAFTDANTYRPPGNPNQRMCRECLRARDRANNAKRRAYFRRYQRSARGREVQRAYRERKRAKT
jgi:hypothetical protein